LLYDTATSKLVAELDDVDGEPRFQFSPDGHRLLTWGARDSNMKLWEPEQGKRVSRLTKHWKPIGFVRFSHDGTHLFTAAFDDKAVVWRTSDGDEVRSFSFGASNPLPLMGDLFHDGTRLLAYVPRGVKPPQADSLQLSVWDVKSGTQLTTLLADGITVRKYQFSPDRARLFVDSSDNSLQVFDTKTLKRISVMAGAELLHFSPDGRRVIVKGIEGVRLLDASTLSPLARMPGQVDAYVSNKGGLFVTCTADGLLMLWNIDTGHEIGQLKGHLDAVTMVMFSDDGRRLVTVGTDNVAKLWALPLIKNMEQLVKDQFESTIDYQKRMTSWSSPYTSLVTLAGYNADAETFALKIGDIGFEVPLARDAARKLAGQRQAVVTGKLQFFDSDQLVLVEPKLSRLP
jgi:WD40 repeat protein